MISPCTLPPGACLVRRGVHSRSGLSDASLREGFLLPGGVLEGMGYETLWLRDI